VEPIGWFDTMSSGNSKTPNSALELPDPYGHGFERM